MYILKNKIKEGYRYSLAKSVYNPKTKRNTSKIVEDLGTTITLQEKLGKNVDIDKWAKEYAKKRTLDGKDNDDNFVQVKFSYNKKNSSKNQKVKNLGYLYLKYTLDKLGMKEILKKIAKKENIKFDLYSITYCLLYCMIMYPRSQLIDTYAFSKLLLLIDDFTYDNFAKAVSCLAKYSYDIQLHCYANIRKEIECDDKLLFYTCNNYSVINNDIYFAMFFPEINSIVTYTRMLIDGNGFPCLLSINNNLVNQNNYYLEFKKFINKYFKDAHLFILPDNLEFNKEQKCLSLFKEITPTKSRPVYDCSKDLKDWILNEKGWTSPTGNQPYNLFELVNKLDDPHVDTALRRKLLKTFLYKYKKIWDDNTDSKQIDQKFIFIWCKYYQSLEIKEYRRAHSILLQQNIEFYLQNTSNENKEEFYKKNKAFLNKNDSTNNIYKNNELYFDDVNLRKNEFYDGINSLIAKDLPDDAQTLANALETKTSWLDTYIKYPKGELSFVSSEASYYDVLNYFYMLCSISTNVVKYLSYKANNQGNEPNILETLRNMNFMKIENAGWLSLYSKNDITKALKKATGIDLDYELISDEDMMKLIS